MGILKWLLDNASGQKPYEREEMEVIDNLLDWEEENDRLLPPGWTPEQIAEVEAQGKIVDLETGEVEDGAVLL